MEYLFLAVVSYLIGAIPFGFLIGNLLRKNLKTLGSGNIGATNTARILGAKYGMLVFLLDFFKCFIIAFLSKKFFGEVESTIFGSLAVFGHMFSIYLKFTGGKGIASILGLYFALNSSLGLIFGLVWISVFVTFRYSSVSSIFSAVFTLLVSYFVLQPEIFYILFSLTVLIVIKHKSNILKLLG